MKSWKPFDKNRDIFSIAVLGSIFLSLWIDFRLDVINRDGICYLLSAENIGRLSLQSIMHLCPQSHWPFYSFLIHCIQKITNFSYVHAAYFINGFFSMGSIIAFLFIVKEMGGSRRVLFLALGIFLLSHEFNSIREYIIRDHGFWTFYLISIYCLMRFIKSPHFFLALSWNTSLLLATLFRIEAAIFLFCVPFIVFFIQNKISKKIKLFLSLHSLNILCALMLLLWLSASQTHHLMQLGRVAELFNQFHQGWLMMFDQFQLHKQSLAQYVLGTDAGDHAGIILLMLLLVWYFTASIGNLSLAYTILCCIAFYERFRSFSKSHQYILISHIMINIAITFGFLLEHYFLSKRYLIALTLTFMLFVPFGLDALIDRVKVLKVRVTLLAIMLLASISALGGILNFGYSKAYIYQAGIWLHQNVSQKASLYANDYQLMYYSRHYGDNIFKKLCDFVQNDVMTNQKWKQYDYLALRIKQKEPNQFQEAIRSLPFSPIQIFQNKKNDRVVIYKINHEKI